MPTPPEPPLVVCLACAADDQSRRAAEIEALAVSLGGSALSRIVSGQTTALRARLPEARAAARFVAGLSLIGAETFENAAGDPAHCVVLLIASSASETKGDFPCAPL